MLAGKVQAKIEAKKLLDEGVKEHSRNHQDVQRNF